MKKQEGLVRFSTVSYKKELSVKQVPKTIALPKDSQIICSARKVKANMPSATSSKKAQVQTNSLIGRKYVC